MKKKKEILPVKTQGKKGQCITVRNKLHGSEITLEVTADYENWNKFFQYIETRKADFPFDFFGSFVSPALENSKEELSQPSGRRNAQDFIDNMKVLAAILYLHLSLKHKGNKNYVDIAWTIEDSFREIFSDIIAGYKITLSGNFYKDYVHEGMKLLNPDKAQNLLAFLNWFEHSDHFKKDNKTTLDRMRKEVISYLNKSI